MEKIYIDTINTSLGIQHNIITDLHIPNKIVSPFINTKPIIIFYEPFEIMIKDTTIYLLENKMTERELLEKYDIDYDSFYNSNIRDNKGISEVLKNKNDVHLFLLSYINDL